jgi:hypothetical protein
MVILNEMVQFQTYFPINLTGDDLALETYLNILLAKKYVRIEGDRYVPTQAGREELERFYTRYYEFIKFFDVFCAVDLEAGEFAFARINEFESDDEWFSFLNDKRFTDVRVAVAEFKGIDPLEIVFMSFLNENRFDATQNGWQYILTDDRTWEDVEEICNSAVSCEYLKSEDVMENIVRQGSELALNLIKEAEEAIEQDAQGEEEVIEEVVTETTTEEYVDVVDMPTYGYTYFAPYYDPFYISPIWLVPVVIF